MVCGFKKDLEAEFYKNHRYRRGYSTTCKECHNADCTRRYDRRKQELADIPASVVAAVERDAERFGIPNPDPRAREWRLPHGRLLFAGKFDRRQFEAVDSFLRLGKRYLAAIGLRDVRSNSLERIAIGYSPDAESAAGRRSAKTELAFRKVLRKFGADVRPAEQDERELEKLGFESPAYRALVRLGGDTVSDEDITLCAHAGDVLLNPPGVLAMTRERWISAREICERLDISLPTLYVMMHDGLWPPGRIVGRRLRKWSEDDYSEGVGRLPSKELRTAA
jgi:predicted DNA-binding transcriptional regulator AlpA